LRYAASNWRFQAMNDPHPAMRFADRLKDLAEGRVEPEDWLAWWETNSADVEAACPRGWFLRLKVSANKSGFGIYDTVWGSQEGAIYILEALKVPFQRSDRYKNAREQEVQRFLAASKARKQERAKRFSPRLAAFGTVFPKFARFLKKVADDIDDIDEPASALEIEAAEKAIGIRLPEKYKEFLGCTKRLSLDGVSIGLDQVFNHPALIDSQSGPVPAICIAEYWLESDGDQVLVECSVSPSQDPPVYYYGHGAGKNLARPLAPSFSAWIESLPKSPVFKR
jgi:hypothetical protein